VAAAGYPILRTGWRAFHARVQNSGKEQISSHPVGGGQGKRGLGLPGLESLGFGCQAALRGQQAGRSGAWVDRYLGISKSCQGFPSVRTLLLCPSSYCCTEVHTYVLYTAGAPVLEIVGQGVLSRRPLPRRHHASQGAPPDATGTAPLDDLPAATSITPVGDPTARYRASTC
jgi:hypothetical protein